MPLPDRPSVLAASQLMATAAFGRLAPPHTEAPLNARLQIDSHECAVHRETDPAARAGHGVMTVYLAGGAAMMTGEADLRDGRLTIMT
jgi:hypothetical protein